MVIYILSLVFLFFLFKLWWHQSSNSSLHLQTALSENSIAQKDARLKDSDDDSLPTSVVQNVQRFLFFVGYARSGHSILGSLLDSHPHMVVAHEYDLFSKWIKNPKSHFDKKWLFNSLLDNSRNNSLQGLRTMKARKKGYTLAIPGGWQGQYNKNIIVIGDKAGGLTAQFFRKNNTLFEQVYQELQKTLDIPVHVLHVIRNPFDNIATMLLYNTHQKQSVNTTSKYKDDFAVREQVKHYFKQVKSVLTMINKVFPLRVIEIHHEDMIFEPKYTMWNICSHLHVECSADYLQLCANSIYTSNSRSRDLIHWSDDNIKLVQDKIQDFTFLTRYTF